MTIKWSRHHDDNFNISVNMYLREREEFILFPNERLFPVKSIVTGHDIDSLHDSFGKSLCGKKSVLTARKSGAGICKMGGHFGGLGMGQLAACINVEYSNPQTFSHLPSPFVSTQAQPHLFFGLSNSSLTIFWSRTSNKQRMNGKEMRRIFVLKFRFWVKNEAKFDHIRQKGHHFLSLVTSEL